MRKTESTELCFSRIVVSRNWFGFEEEAHHKLSQNHTATQIMSHALMISCRGGHTMMTSHQHADQTEHGSAHRTNQRVNNKQSEGKQQTTRG